MIDLKTIDNGLKKLTETFSKYALLYFNCIVFDWVNSTVLVEPQCQFKAVYVKTNKKKTVQQDLKPSGTIATSARAKKVNELLLPELAKTVIIFQVLEC